MKLIHNLILKLIILFNFSLDSFATSPNKNDNIYEFSFINLTNEKPINLSDFKGKVILIVNTASKCGFTKQYEGLEKLHQKYNERGLVIIGVPSDNFGGQEYSNDSQIKHFCKYNYGVNFLMTKKENVVGDNAHPFYKFIRNEFGILKSPKWNFYKYLFDRNGNLVDYFISSTEPESQKLIKVLEKTLK